MLPTSNALAFVISVGSAVTRKRLDGIADAALAIDDESSAFVADNGTLHDATRHPRV